jgi:hypothetical protein
MPAYTALVEDEHNFTKAKAEKLKGTQGDIGPKGSWRGLLI